MSSYIPLLHIKGTTAYCIFELDDLQKLDNMNVTKKIDLEYLLFLS